MSSNPLIRVNKKYYQEAKKLMTTGLYSNLEEAYQEVLMRRKAEEVTSLLRPMLTELNKDLKQLEDNNRRGGFLYG